MRHRCDGIALMLHILVLNRTVLAKPGGEEESSDKGANISKPNTPIDKNGRPIWPTEDYPTSELEISVSARNLTGQNTVCVVYVKKPEDWDWIEYHRTETVPNGTDPDFASKFLIPFHFGWQQPIQFTIYHHDTTDSNSINSPAGFATSSLAEIMYKGKGKITFELSPLAVPSESTVLESEPHTTGNIIINASELSSSNEQADIQLGGLEIKTGWFESIKNQNRFLEIHRAADQHSTNYVLVYRTEVVRENPDPKWKRFILPMKQLSDGDSKRTLKFECWNWNSNGKHTRIGGFMSTVKELRRGDKRRFPIADLNSKNIKNYGWIDVELFKVVKGKSFLDFIIGGLQMHTFVAIDYSKRNVGYNKELNRLSSLHHLKPVGETPNVYEQAIASVVPAMGEFDEEKRFPVYGFPDTLPYNYKHIEHGSLSYNETFNVNLDHYNPICLGAQGILKAYRKSFKLADLSSIPVFESFLYEVEEIAKKHRDNYYHVALNLTTGRVLDRDAWDRSTYYLDKCSRGLKALSFSNTSVVIIGMGDGDFADMETVVTSSDRLKRDFVNFLEFNEFVSPQESSVDGLRLARAALHRLPRQVVTYMLLNDIEPGGRPSVANINHIDQ